ncbi:hypothetical protein C4K68_09640 [Pokkaliibacter plantistimulans]|uniref:Uncharacterized protein n=1 Tax=Proteobacteria bacterium 228 TaxID=2083153 RepID=A0A2S5KRX2_9PROT|nr:hypothetical protein [Pokkaliibacter plantistimulans]PPC77611.1 hypothetical protein C4K68_09640 [Pokkaliibacter plantistimulans]
MSLPPLSPEIKAKAAETDRQLHIANYASAEKKYDQWVSSLTNLKLNNGASYNPSVRFSSDGAAPAKYNVPLVQQYLHDRFDVFSREFVKDGQINEQALNEIVLAGQHDTADHQAFRSDNFTAPTEPHYYLAAVVGIVIVMLLAWLLKVLVMKRRSYGDVLKQLFLSIMFPVPRLLSLGNFKVDWEKAIIRRGGLLSSSLVLAPGLFTIGLVYAAGLSVFPSSWASQKHVSSGKYLVTDLAMYTDVLKGQRGDALMAMVAITSHSWNRDKLLENRDFSDNIRLGSNIWWAPSVYSCDLMLDMRAYAKAHGQSWGGKTVVEQELAASIIRWYKRDMAKPNEPIGEITRQFNDSFDDVPRGMDTFNECYVYTNTYSRKREFLAFMKQAQQ